MCNDSLRNQAPTFDPTRAPDPDDVIPADSNDSSEVDSALGDDISVQSESLRSSVYNYPYEHGRRYHAYHQGEYLLPNDEAEQDRLDLVHHIFRLLLNGRLFRAPICPTPQRVLDFGTGTGMWAIDFADEFPTALVIGTDLSPIQPHLVPPNVTFYVDDVESEWIETRTSDDRYDFIHGRYMAGSIKDWPKLYRQAMRSSKPGGWVEIQEFETWMHSDDFPDLAPVPYLKQFQSEVNKASGVFGKDLNIARKHKQHLIDAGFVNVRDEVYKVPIGPWPRDPKLKELGKYQLVAACDAVEPFALGFLPRYSGWEVDKCRVFVKHVIEELHTCRHCLYMNYHFVYGQKPEV